MRTERSRRPRLGDLTFALLAAALAVAAPGPAQEAPGTSVQPAASVPAPAPAPPPAGLYVGPASCAQDACHGATRPRQVFDVLQNEYYTWLQRDRHAQAYEVLYDPRSTAIASNLGLDTPAYQAPGCLGCHTLSPPAGRAGPGVEATDGVSCESCHGPASGWRGGHTAETWSHEDSVAAGMRDLEDPGTRSAVCLSCHLGGSDRVVDHDLIAAGHPALRFELDSYSQAMPAHWRADPAEGVRVWAVGQAAALRDSARELARRAREGRWPDFSWLSCDACHHDLAAERYRRGLGTAYRARPGLPPWSPARWVVLRVLVERYQPDDAAPLGATVDRLARQVSRLTTPPAEVAATAEELAQRLDAVSGCLAEVRWTPGEARRLLLALTAGRDSLAAADAAAAAQSVQAVYTLTGYLLAEQPELLQRGLVDTVSALARELQEGEDFDRDQFRRTLAMVEERVQ